MGFTSLAYLMDIDWLHEAWRRTRKSGAVGVDGQTAADYERDLESNLRSLLDRAKSGTYRAPPVRRVHIPKGGSKSDTRPIAEDHERQRYDAWKLGYLESYELSATGSSEKQARENLTTVADNFRKGAERKAERAV
jgi:hypothetical protein